MSFDAVATHLKHKTFDSVDACVGFIGLEEFKKQHLTTVHTQRSSATGSFSPLSSDGRSILTGRRDAVASSQLPLLVAAIPSCGESMPSKSLLCRALLPRQMEGFVLDAACERAGEQPQNEVYCPPQQPLLTAPNEVGNNGGPAGTHNRRGNFFVCVCVCLTWTMDLQCQCDPPTPPPLLNPSLPVALQWGGLLP
ncbi:uncharacterized protein V6R79_008486 [Siganus canaliculatus]